MNRRTLGLALGALVAGACASPGGSPSPAAGGRVASGFPPPDALYELREKPLPPGSPFGTGYRDVSSWDLVGPFPEIADTSPRRGADVWDPLLDELIQSRAGLVIASEGMACFAREAGHFVAALQAQPGLALQRFLAGRCGLISAQPALVSLSWESSRSLDLEAALRELRDPIAQALREHAVGGPLDLGMWLQSAEGRIDLVIARGERGVRLDPVPMQRSPEGTVVLRGEVLQGAAGISASVTHGELGWEDCAAAEGVELPRFHFVCSIGPSDPTTWLSLQYLPVGHVLQRSGTQLLIRAPGEQASSFRRRAYAKSRQISDANEVPAAFLELLNQVRSRAEAPPLLLAAEQSRVAGEVAPYYFAAMGDRESEAVAELVALGMMAGWEIPEIVQEGLFLFTWLVESRDVGSLLSDVLESPGARSMLLADDLERIAIGPVAGREGEVDYVALIVSTYRLFSEKEHREHASRVVGGLARARAERGRAAPGELEQVRPLAVAAAARVQAGAPPEDVLGDLIQESVDTLNRSVVGWVAETQDLDDIVFPDDFLERADLDIAIAVSTRRPEGEAWGRYVVLIVASAGPDRRAL